MIMFEEDDANNVLLVITFIACASASCTQGKSQVFQFSTNL